MNIVFLVRYDPKDINYWSGTLYHIYHKLKEKHRIEIIGIELLGQATYYTNGNFPKNMFLPVDRYVKNFGRLLSEKINALKFDLIFFGDLLFYPLDIHIPFVHFSDMTYDQVNVNLANADQRNLDPCMHLEKMQLNACSRIIYCSEWIKKKAMEVYGIDPNKIDIVELGANIPAPTGYSINIDMAICRLVFVGKNWKKKGGDKVLKAYRILKKENFPCSLTIIGSVPNETMDEDEDITVIPFLDKSKSEQLEKFCNILSEAHFLILPTDFDAYGIVFCEASAYAVPSIASNVGGVGQPVIEGKNGFLLSTDATAHDYAEKIKNVFQDKENYIRLRASSRCEFETRLNWDIWGARVNAILEDTLNEWNNKHN